MKKIAALILALGMSLAALAQNATLRGVVQDTAGQPVVGAFVVEQGTQNGTVTDLDGAFVLRAPKGSTVEISCIGYVSQTFGVTADQTVTVILEDDAEMLDETVVIGYGVQKKSVVTASIAKVSDQLLENVAPVRVDAALKGLAAGVTVTSSSGQPGASSQVRVRGIGTINDSNPLYIVDGMPVDINGIDYINPSDILSVEVLKDAASGAVYGARAANGVILVTTKSGQKGSARVSYNYTYGVQNPWKKYDVLNATEYAILMNEGYMNEGKAPVYADPYALGKGTDWQDEIFNYNAPKQSHQLSVSGGTDLVNYYISLGYDDQEGIVGGNWDHSNYKRLSLRSNTNFNLLDKTKERHFLNKITAGINLSYSRAKSMGITTNSEFGGPLGSALGMAPTISPWAADNSILEEHPDAVVDPRDGRAFTIVDGAIYNELLNPLAQLAVPASKGNSDKFVTNFWLETALWDSLKFKSSFGGDLSFWGSDWWSPKVYYSSKSFTEYSSAGSSMNRAFTWLWENTLSWDKTFGAHSIQALLGQSAQSNVGQGVSGSNKYLIEENPYMAGIWFTTGTQGAGDMNASGYVYNPHRISSLFARLSYNYAERYMFQATVRRDGSSNFGPSHRFATFPSFSLGWNFTNEPFFQAINPGFLSLGKFRFSWGKNGNESIGQYRFTTTVATGNNYAFGNGPAVITTGAKPNGFANSDLRWEESEQTDIGLDLAFWNSAFTFTVDWYRKRTNGMLMNMPIPAYAGDSAPVGNVGTMDNKGWEFEANWKHDFNGFFFQIGGNATYLKNVLVNLGNDTGYANYDSHKIGTLTRGENGYPFPFFYGWKTDGIFQNWDEVNGYTNAEGGLIQPKAQPGDVRFVDVNGNGAIDDDDRTYLGKGMPDWTFGLHLNMAWKGLDLSAVFQGVLGAQAMNVTRRTDLFYINLPKYMLGRWTGEGTSNKYPRMTMATDANENWRSSDLWIEDASYFRLKNLQIGYTLPQSLTRKIFIDSLRLFVMGENVFTLTNYTGFDPEVSSGGTSLGIDRGVYPQARVWSVGVNVTL